MTTVIFSVLARALFSTPAPDLRKPSVPDWLSGKRIDWLSPNRKYFLLAIFLAYLTSLTQCSWNGAKTNIVCQLILEQKWCSV